MTPACLLVKGAKRERGHSVLQKSKQERDDGSPPLNAVLLFEVLVTIVNCSMKILSGKFYK